MKYVFIPIIFSVFFFGCADEVSTATPESTVENQKEESENPEKPEPSQQEMENNTMNLIATVLSPSDLGLELNQENPWRIPNESYTKLMKIKQQIYVISGNMENYEVSSYNEMGKEFLDFVKTIPAPKDDMTNYEMQKVISLTKEQCFIMLGTNKQQAQIAVINLSVIFDEIPNFFIAE